MIDDMDEHTFREKHHEIFKKSNSQTVFVLGEDSTNFAVMAWALASKPMVRYQDVSPHRVLSKFRPKKETHTHCHWLDLGWQKSSTSMAILSKKKLVDMLDSTKRYSHQDVLFRYVDKTHRWWTTGGFSPKAKIPATCLFNPCYFLREVLFGSDLKKCLLRCPWYLVNGLKLNPFITRLFTSRKMK